MSRLSERLSVRIQKEFGIRCLPETFRRTYAGFWMKTQGAFVWEMDCVGGGTIGSMYPASDIVKKSSVLSFDPRECEIFIE